MFFFWGTTLTEQCWAKNSTPFESRPKTFFLFSGKRERPKTGAAAVDAEVFDMRGWERMGGGWAKFFFSYGFFGLHPKEPQFSGGGRRSSVSSIYYRRKEMGGQLFRNNVILFCAKAFVVGGVEKMGIFFGKDLSSYK